MNAQEWLDNLTGGMEYGPPTEDDVLAMVAALQAVLELHVKVVTDQHIDGPTAVCEPCSEDRMLAEWPCPTITTITEALGEE